jgi:hypothetical protein
MLVVLISLIFLCRAGISAAVAGPPTTRRKTIIPMLGPAGEGREYFDGRGAEKSPHHGRRHH